MGKFYENSDEHSTSKRTFHNSIDSVLSDIPHGVWQGVPVVAYLFLLILLPCFPSAVSLSTAPKCWKQKIKSDLKTNFTNFSYHTFE